MANTAELNIWVKLKDDATKALTGLNGTIDKLQPTFQKMSVVGVAGLAALGAAAYKSIKDFGEAEKAMKQLEHTTINVAKGTMENVKALSALADAEQRRGVLDGDAIRAGQAQLMTFGLSTDMVLKLTQSMSDLAVNQFGVNAGQEQLSQTANIMAKALNGQFGILEKSGIRFTEAQRKMIEFGTETEKASALQEGLAQNLKFTNEVALQTFEGQMAKLNTSIGDISEGIGAALMPAMLKLVTVVTPIVEKMVAWAGENPKLIATIGAVAAGIFALLAVVGTLGIAIPAITAGFGALATAATFLGGAFTIMLGPVGLVIAILAALVAAGVLVYKNWDEITAFASSAWGSITATINGAMTSIQNTFTAVWEGIKAAFQMYVDFTIGLWATLLDFLVPGWDTALMAIWAKAVEIWEMIKGYLSSVFGAITAAIGSFLDTLLGYWTSIWTAVADVFSQIWDSITAIFNAAAEGITATMETLTKPIQKVIDLAQKAIDLAGGALNKAKGGVSKAISSILDRGSSITGSKKANGGFVRAGESYIVGERGPEILTPAFPGGIIPNHGLGGMNVTVNFSNNKFVSPKEEARAMGNELVRYLKDNYRV
jgi:phage-related protein